MTRLSFLNRYFSPLLLLLTLVASAFWYVSKPTIGVWSLMENYPTTYLLCYLLVVFFPLVFLIGSRLWQETKDPYRRWLIGGMTTFFISTLYSMPVMIYSAALFFFIAIVYAVKERKVYRPHWLFYLFMLYFLVHLVSLLWSVDRVYGWSRLAIYIYFVAFPVVFLFFQWSRREIKAMLVIFFRAALLMACLSIVVWIFEVADMDVPFARWFYFQKGVIGTTHPAHYMLDWLGFDHPTFVMISLCTAAIVGVFLYFSERRHNVPSIRWFDLLIFLAVAVVVSLVTVSRVGTLVLMGVIFLAITWRLYYVKKIWAWLLLFLGAVAMIFSLYAVKLGMISNDVERLRLYEVAFAEIEKSPILGTGVGGMLNVIHTARADEAHLGVLINKHPHNQFVGDWMQTGVLGLVALVALFLSLLYVAIRYQNGLLLAFLFMFLPNMLIDMPFIGFKGTVQFVPFVCLLLQQIYAHGQWVVKTKTDD